MSEKERTAAGYYFADDGGYREAKREEETVEYIRAHTDLSDINKAAKLYHKLVERGTFKTIVGFDFLQELKRQVIRGGIVTEAGLPPIRIEKEDKKIRAYNGELSHEAEERHLEAIEELRIKLRSSRIICGFLIVIILAMLLISVFSDRSVFVNKENEIINKYSAWEEELDAREKALKERETADSLD